MFNQNYSYEIGNHFDGLKYDNQKKMLKDAGLDDGLLDTVMSVYIMDIPEENTIAYYRKTIKDSSVVLDIVGGVIADIPMGICVWPYIIVRPNDSFTVEQKQVVNHELFHHYQAQMFDDYDHNRTTGEMGSESTAQWASAMITENTDYTEGILNDWCSEFAHYSDRLLDYYLTKYGDDCAGYALLPLLYNYSQEVNDSTEKIIYAYYSADFLASLESQSSIGQRKQVMRKLLLYTLNNDYSNKNLVNSGRKSISYTSLFKVRTDKVWDEHDLDLAPAAIDYYIYKKKGDQDVDFVFEDAIGQVNAVLIAKIDGKYQIIQSYDDSIGKLSTYGVEGVDQFYLAVYNTSFTENCGIYFYVEEHSGSEVPAYEFEEETDDNPTIEDDTKEEINAVIPTIEDEENIIESNQTVLDNETIKVVARKLEIKDSVPILHITLTNNSDSELDVRFTGCTINGIDYGSAVDYTMEDEQGERIYNISDLKTNESIDVVLRIEDYVTTWDSYEKMSALKALNISTFAQLGFAIKTSTETSDSVVQYFEVKTKYYNDYDFNQCVLQDYLESIYGVYDEGFSAVLLNTNVAQQVSTTKVLADAIVTREDGSMSLLVEMNVAKNSERSVKLNVSHINTLDYDSFYYVKESVYVEDYKLYDYHGIVEVELGEICDEAIRKYFGLVEIGSLTYRVITENEEISITEKWADEVCDLNGEVIYEGKDVTIICFGFTPEYNDHTDSFENQGLFGYFAAVSHSEAEREAFVSCNFNNGEYEKDYVHIQNGETKFFITEIVITDFEEYEYADVRAGTKLVEYTYDDDDDYQETTLTIDWTSDTQN